VSPTVLESGPYRFFFYSSDRGEPPHVHVERDANQAKYWLLPVRLARGGGFTAVELARIEAIIRREQRALLKAWDEYFIR
jgi:hypothetical protein